ncbi:MAG: SDR family oxidoreductase [Sandaracinaceae bacterium]
MDKTILITGTSTGVGYGATKALSAAGYRVIATVRSAEDAERLTQELGSGVHPVLCDVTRPDDVAALPAHVARISENGWLDGLVNNAAIELIAPAELQPMEDIRALFETNVFGLMAVTKALLPVLGTAPEAGEHEGRIVNVSSIGGVLALPLLSAYAATKHAIEGYSHSLRRELRGTGVRVIILGPGAIRSALWRKHLPRMYEGTPYERSMANLSELMRTSEAGAATEDAIGQFIRKLFEVRRPRARYVFTPNRLTNWTLPTLASHEMVDRMVARMI